MHGSASNGTKNYTDGHGVRHNPHAGRAVFRADGLEGLAEWLTDEDNFPPGMTLYVLENDSVDILGREFPWFLWPAQQAMGGAQRAAPAPATNRAGTRFRQGVTGSDGTRYTFIVGPVPQPPLGAFGLPSVQWLVLLTAVLATAVACLALTRPTSPQAAAPSDGGRLAGQG